MTAVKSNAPADSNGASAPVDATKNPDYPKEVVWDGRIDHFSKHEVVIRDALADAAKVADWEGVFRLLDTHTHELSPNSWRPNGKTWYTPLHQAAWHNAPVSVIDELIQRGGWSSLRTAYGETAYDIAMKNGHTAIGESLAQQAPSHINNDVFSKLDEHMSRLIESRIRPALAVQLRPPAAEVVAEIADQPLWFPVPGMYGGFSIRFMRSYLFVESWCRVVGGSGQAHVVTSEGFTLVEEGFV